MNSRFSIFDDDETLAAGGTMACPPGQRWDAAAGACKFIPTPCPPGHYWNDTMQLCVDAAVFPPDTVGIQFGQSTMGTKPPRVEPPPPLIPETIFGFPTLYVAGAAAIGVYLFSSMGKK